MKTHSAKVRRRVRKDSAKNSARNEPLFLAPVTSCEPLRYSEVTE
jgi:hypothetical protein